MASRGSLISFCSTRSTAPYLGAAGASASSPMPPPPPPLVCVVSTNGCWLKSINSAWYWRQPLSQVMYVITTRIITSMTTMAHPGRAMFKSTPIKVPSKAIGTIILMMSQLIKALSLPACFFVAFKAREITAPQNTTPLETGTASWGARPPQYISTATIMPPPPIPAAEHRIPEMKRTMQQTATSGCHRDSQRSSIKWSSSETSWIMPCIALWKPTAISERLA
mmetsp:Transcript_12785/g.30598  ORF Transcript_12785/g.30598 Transcript_12785/m.30598 type:complete len:223 (+) Transcript_12785:744-1412(+)